MAYKTSPELLEALKLISAQLPVVNNSCHEKHLLKGSEIMEWETVDEIDGQKIDSDKTYLYKFPVSVASNHYRRLKKAWKKNGKPGVQHYLKIIENLMANQPVNQ